MRFVTDGPPDGPAVLLSNSIGSTLEIWQAQVEPLTNAGFRVIRYDTRGHGELPVPPGPYRIEQLGNEALELLDHLSVQTAHLVGTSLGGMLGIWLAAFAPERVRTLTVCCSSARPGNQRMWLERAARAREEGMADIAEASIERWFTRTWLAANLDEAKRFREMTAATPAEGYAGCCELLGELDLTDQLARITAPSLVIAGADDQALPPEHSELIAARIPSARLEVLDGAAHLAGVERADRVNQLLIEHLTRQE